MVTPSTHVLPERPEPPLVVAVSECLLGSPVRHDGAHKRSSLCHDVLTGVFEFRGFCPEVAIGLGVPREPIRLVGEAASPRAVGVRTATLDVTDALADYGRRIGPGLGDVDGYIFMKDSPSCGLYRVRVYPERDAGPHVQPTRTGRGIFAAQMVAERPDLPVEESGRMNDPVLRENFVTRTFVHAHWRRLRDAGLTAARLIAFHSVYKYLIMAHSVPAYQRLGRLLADLSGNVTDIAGRYFSGLMTALAHPAGRGGHANVLSHLAGYVKRDLSADARQELDLLIQSYRRGEVPLLAPLTLLKHHLGNHEAVYAINQVYLEPHPAAAGYRRQL